MKRATRPSTRHTYDPSEHPQPPQPSQDEIGAMADRVMAGEVVVAPFENGVFVLLMIELGLRGWFKARMAAPFTIVVAKENEHGQ